MSELLAAIKEVLKQDHVTFAELGRLDGFKGELMMFAGPGSKNIVLWSGVSQAAVDAIEAIRAEGEYELTPTGMLTYLVDGECLTLPIAKQAKRAYKHPHWCPIVFTRKR